MTEKGDMFESRVDLTKLSESIAKTKSEIGKVIVGQDRMIELLMAAILADGHVLIEGVPGVAKTLTARILSRIISAGFSRVQFTPDLMPSDILGTSIYNLKTSQFEFKAGPIFSNIILIDEINRAPAKTQSALFEVMEERQVTLDGTTHSLDSPFMVVATQNPIDLEGTYRLPEAQLDRFLFKIEVDYPALDEEIMILEGHHQIRNLHHGLSQINPVLNAEQISDFRKTVGAIHVDKPLFKYIAQIIEETRNNKSLFLGGSPRASIYLLFGAKAMAAIRGRDFITPEDIKDIAFPVLNHRIIMTPEKEMEGVTSRLIIEQIVDKIEVPR